MYFGTAHKEEERVGKDLPWTLTETTSALQSMKTCPGDGFAT